MAKLTFIMPIYSPTSDELSYWQDASNEITKLGHQFIVVIDNEQITLDDYFSKDVEIIVNERNLGKYKSVINSKSKWRNDWIKVVDPDDYISINSLKNIEEKLCGKTIFRLSSVRISSRLEKIDQNEIENVFESQPKGQYRTSLGNSFTILPAKPFFDDERISSKRIHYNDDQLFGQICLSAGYSITDIEDAICLYVVENGVSSPNNVKNYIYKLEETINEYIRLRNIYKYDNELKWPNFNYYNGLVFKSKISIASKIKLLLKIRSYKIKVRKSLDKRRVL